MCSDCEGLKTSSGCSLFYYSYNALKAAVCNLYATTITADIIRLYIIL